MSDLIAWRAPRREQVTYDRCQALGRSDEPQWFQYKNPHPFQPTPLHPKYQRAEQPPKRHRARPTNNDFEVNVKAELEIELLHQKIDLMKEKELFALIKSVEALSQRLDNYRNTIEPTQLGSIPT